LPKLDFTTGVKYVINLGLVNIDIGCKRATVQFIIWVCYRPYLHNDIFLTDITGYDRLKFS